MKNKYHMFSKPLQQAMIIETSVGDWSSHGPTGKQCFQVRILGIRQNALMTWVLESKVNLKSRPLISNVLAEMS